MEDAPFLRAIEESPDDDAPRLVYADWLEERSDSRARSIRAQCQLAKSEPYTPRWHELRLECELLLGEYRDSLAAKCETLTESSTLQLHRGFPIRMPIMTDQLPQLAVLGAHVPVCSVILRPHQSLTTGHTAAREAAERLSRVSDLMVYSLTGELPDVFQWPFPSVQTLTLAGGMDAPALPASFSDTGLSQQLESLWLRGKVKQPRTAGAVEFPRLRRLRLSSVSTSRSMVVSAPQLETLSIADDSPQQLAALPLEQLRSLSVHSKRRETLESLAQCGAFQKLRCLNLTGVDLSVIEGEFSGGWADSMEQLMLWTQAELRQNILACRLVESLRAGQLKHARGRNWGPHELSALLQGEHPLESLVLTHSDFDPGPVELPFATGPLTKTLRRLEFRNCHLSGELVEAISRCSFDETTTLSLSECAVHGVQQLLAADAFPNLRVLDLSSLDLRGGRLASAIQTLLKGNYPHLLELNLDETPVTPKQARELLQSPRFPKLQRFVHRQFRPDDRTQLAREFAAKFDSEPLDAIIVDQPSADYARL